MVVLFVQAEDGIRDTSVTGVQTCALPICQMTAGVALRVEKAPRITRLMALAVKFEGLIQQGVVKDYAELARLGQVSRARITQIMNLLNLAPDIQEAILFMTGEGPAEQRLRETSVRTLSAEVIWS